MNFDMHIHTSYSDGTDDVSKLIAKIKEANIARFSITDHDNLSALSALSPHKIELTREGIRYVDGIEFSCCIFGREMHILGYNFDATSPVMSDFVANSKAKRMKKREIKMSLLQERYNIVFTQNELDLLNDKDRMIGSIDFAKIMHSRGYLGSIDSLIKTCIKPLTGSELEADAIGAIDAIKKSGGIAMLAHPILAMIDNGMSYAELDELVVKLMQNGLDGVEVFHSRHTKDDVQIISQLASKYSILVSGGSDYHGGNKKGVMLGKACDYELNYQECAIVKPFMDKLFG